MRTMIKSILKEIIFFFLNKLVFQWLVKMFDFVRLAFVLWKSLHSPPLNMGKREYLVQTQSKTKPFFIAGV